MLKMSLKNTDWGGDNIMSFSTKFVKRFVGKIFPVLRKNHPMNISLGVYRHRSYELFTRRYPKSLFVFTFNFVFLNKSNCSF